MKTNFIDKFFGPGLFRLFLASIVFIHHLSSVNIGVSAVLVFFFLSGFWISKMYKEKYSLKKHPKTTFYISRILRIFPIFILANIILFFLDHYLSLNYIDNLKLNWMPNYIIFGFNFLETQNRLIVPVWSLELELIYYLIFPFIFIIKDKIKIFILYAILILISLYDIFVNTDKILLSYFIFFVGGNLAYKISINVKKKIAILSILIFLFIIFISFFINNNFNPLIGGQDHSLFFKKYNLIFNFIIAFLLIPFAIITLKSKNNFNKDKFFGDMSYSVYLFHWITCICLDKYLINSLDLKERFFYTFVYVIITYLVCIIITKYYDYYFEKFRKHTIKKM